MASQSTAPTTADPAAGEEKPPTATPAPAAAAGDNKDSQSSREEAATESFKRSISAGLQHPIREDQIQNAVKFLSHPKVRGSPVIYRRSFLEKKGLTREEIDEAFRRVPDPHPNVAGVETSKPTQGDAPKPATSLQPQVPTQNSQTAVIPSNVSPMAPASRTPIFLAVGVLASVGAGSALVFKTVVLPKLKAWIRKVAKDEDNAEKKDKPGPRLAEEDADTAKTAAAAAVMAKACQDLLSEKSEEKKLFETFIGLLDAQVKELKSVGSALRNLEATREVTHPQEKRIEDIQSAWENGSTSNVRMNPNVEQSDRRLSSMSHERKMNGTLDGAVRSSSTSASVETTATPYPKSFMEIMAMVQRGETPPGIKEINDMPPNPNQQPSNPRLVPRAKPWEAARQVQQNSYVQPQGRFDGPVSGAHDNGQSSQVNGKSFDSSEPWWKQKSPQIAEIEDEGEEPKVTSYGIGSKNWPGREWVPPQTPSVAIPEAAAAIRKPKQPVQKQLVTELSGQPIDREGEAAGTTDSAVRVERSSDMLVDTNLESEIQEHVDGV